MICRQAENKLFRHPVPIRSVIFIGLFLVPAGMLPAQIYPFQDPGMPVEQRIDDIISLMTREEKIKCLSTDTGVPRLGIAGSRQVEGLHGLAKGGPSNWGQIDPVPTTIFPQAIGLAETWDPEAVERVAAIEGYEARYIFQSPKYKKGGDRHPGSQCRSGTGSTLGAYRRMLRRGCLVQRGDDRCLRQGTAG